MKMWSDEGRRALVASMPSYTRFPQPTYDEYWNPTLRHDRLERYSLAIRRANEDRRETFIFRNYTYTFKDILRFVPKLDLAVRR